MTASIYQPGIDVQDTQLRQDLASISSASVGAGMVGYDEALPYTGNTVGKELDDINLAITNLQQDVTEGYASIVNFGAIGNGIADDGPAIAAAIASNDRVYFPNPSVCWRVNTPISISLNNMKFLGENRESTKIRAFNNSLPVISIVSGTTGVEINNLHLERSLAASSTGSGIECSGTSSGMLFDNLVIDGQWHGISLGDTDRGLVTRCRILNNYGNGINIATGSTGNTVWDITSTQIGYNNGHGISINGIGAAVASTIGELDRNLCVYNGGYGLSVVGQASKRLNSLRVTGGAYSFNNAGGIFLDTYAGRHRISGSSVTLSGTVASGRQSTPISASSVGDGILLSANNNEVNIAGVIAQGNSHSGIAALSTSATIVGNSCNNNGANTVATSSLRTGIRLNGGQFVVTGNTAINTAGVTTQQQGIHITAGTNCILSSNNVAGNALTPGITIVTPGNSNRIVDNAGYNPQPMTSVTASASPWTYTAGNSPETLYLTGGAMTSITQDGIAIPGYNNTVINTFQLGPNESIIFTYSTVPTNIRRKIH